MHQYNRVTRVHKKLDVVYKGGQKQYLAGNLRMDQNVVESAMSFKLIIRLLYFKMYLFRNIKVCLLAV